MVNFQTIKAFLRLIRWQTLLFLMLAQFLVRYGLIAGVLPGGIHELQMLQPEFLLLVFSTVILAAAGFVINDYFDVKNDMIKHPAKVVVDVKISRHTVIRIHTVFNIIGVLAGSIAAIIIGRPIYSLIFVIISVLLFLYSAKLNRRVPWGGLLIALFPFIAVELVWLFEANSIEIIPVLQLEIARIVAFYGFVAFLSTLILELIKSLSEYTLENVNKHSFVHQIGKSKAEILIFILMFLCAGLLISTTPLLFFPEHKITLSILLVSLVVNGVAMYLFPKAITRNNFSSVVVLIKSAMLIGVLSMLTIII